jgi:hypothetical protein
VAALLLFAAVPACRRTPGEKWAERPAASPEASGAAPAEASGAVPGAAEGSGPALPPGSPPGLPPLPPPLPTVAEPVPALAGLLAPLGFVPGEPVDPGAMVPLPGVARAEAGRFRRGEEVIDALVVSYPNARFARPHVSDANTPDPGARLPSRLAVSRAGLVLEVRGLDARVVREVVGRVAAGWGVALDAGGLGEAAAPAEGSGAPAAR